MIDPSLPAGALASLLLAASDPAAHVVNHPFISTESGWWLWSANIGNLVLSGIILLIGIRWAAGRIDTGPESAGHDRYLTKGSLAHLIEVMCIWLREDMCRPLLKDRTDRMMPFMWTLFFFMLINNLLGLLPFIDLQNLPYYFAGEMPPHRAFIGGTATQNLYVTGAMAVLAGIVFNVAAIRRLGIGGYFHHQTSGSPWYVWPIVFPIEVIGNIIVKPGALAIRLFANMTAGHLLLAVLFGFVGAVFTQGLATAVPVTLASVIGAIGIFLLEILVAVIQAFIFMFLVVVFVSLLDHEGEEHTDTIEFHEGVPA